MSKEHVPEMGPKPSEIHPELQIVPPTHEVHIPLRDIGETVEEQIGEIDRIVDINEKIDDRNKVKKPGLDS